jgi:peptidoglycan/LPS O-acetylase OafA/YrhL
MTSNGGRPLGNGEIRSFTGLRGCAAVMVMFYHFTLNMPGTTLPTQWLLLNGYLWVDLFFILSGFVMAYSHATFFSRGQPLRTHLRFLLTRIARIYPLYLVILLESACLLLWRTPGHDPREFTRTFLLNLTMVQAWGLAPSMEGAAWSISTEWAAYLVFPLLFAATVLSSRRVACVAATLSAVVILCLAFSPGPFTFPDQSRGGPLDIYSSATVAPVFRCLAEFNLGLLAYRMARSVARRPHAWAGAGSIVTMAAILTAMCWQGLDAAIVFLFAGLLVTLAPGRGILARVLSSPVPYALGRWSYSIYLIHDKFSHPTVTLEHYLADYMPFAPVAAAAAMACVVVACSAATFKIVEQPMRRWLHEKVRRLPILKDHRPSRDTRPVFETVVEPTGSP